MKTAEIGGLGLDELWKLFEKENKEGTHFFFKVLERLEALGPDGDDVEQLRARTWLELGNTYCRVCKFKEALERFDLVLASPALGYLIETLDYPVVPTINLYRARGLMLHAGTDSQRREELFEEAERLLVAGIKGVEDADLKAIGYMGMGRLRTDQKRYDMAIPWFKKALETAPQKEKTSFSNSWLKDDYEWGLHKYAFCLMVSPDPSNLPSALRMAQQGVDDWTNLMLKNVAWRKKYWEDFFKVEHWETSVEPRHRIWVARWLYVLADIHFRLGSMKVAFRYGEMGKTEKALSGVKNPRAFYELYDRDTNFVVLHQQICSNCFKMASKDPMPKCAKCFSEFYCNVECQSERWPIHSSWCKKLREERKKETV
jgi:tetratricopeptide (TPR) repeat protein